MNPSPDFGVKFGCRFYVASVNEEASSRGLVVGDTLLEVGGASVEGLSLAKVGRMVKMMTMVVVMTMVMMVTMVMVTMVMVTIMMMTMVMVTKVIMNPV